MTSSADAAVSEATSAVPLDAPSVTSDVVTDIHQTSTEVSYDQQSSMEHATTAGHGHKTPQKSRALVRDKQMSCLLSSSCAKISQKEASLSRPRTYINRGQRKTASGAVRVTTAHRVILPATAAKTSSSNHHSNILATSSTADAKTRLREVILSGSRQQPRNGNSTVFCYYVFYAFTCSIFATIRI